MDLRPLQTEADYECALADIDRLMGRELAPEDADRLDVLVTLVEAYEMRHWPVDLPDPVSAIVFVMEQRDLNAAGLGEILGSRAVADEVLHRRRALSLDMIRRLHETLGIPAEVLIRDYALSQPAA